MKKRLFIAFSLTKKIKDEIEVELSKIKDRFRAFEHKIRYIPNSYWHITLLFLGYQQVEDIKFIREAMDEAAHRFYQFEIDFSKIDFDPQRRMIWLYGQNQSSLLISKIKEFLEYKIAQKLNFKLEERKFQLHTTLARFKSKIYNLPKLNISFKKRIEVKEINLMESVLKREGAEYYTIYKAILNKPELS